MTFVIEKLVFFLTKLISFSMFKDGQAIIIQIWMLICKKQLPNNCLCHSGTSESWRSCPNPMRQANFILCGQFFSQCSTTQRIDSDAFASCHLKYIIKKCPQRDATHRCEPALWSHGTHLPTTKPCHLTSVHTHIHTCIYTVW